MTHKTRKTKNSTKYKAAVIGSPIHHSKSPLLHNYFLKQYNINAEYNAIEIKTQNELNQFMNELRTPTWLGINITIPHKESVIQYLDEQSESVKIIGACNTIINENGRLIGHNTDAEGFFYPLKNHNIKSAMVLGNGGAAKAVLYQLCKTNTPTITLVARNHSKSEKLCKALEKKFDTHIRPISFSTLDRNPTLIKAIDIIINTTSVGLATSDQPFHFLNLINKQQLFYDLIYNPWETPMIKLSKRNHAKTLNGAHMLAHQAALAFKLIFKKNANTDTMINLLESNR